LAGGILVAVPGRITGKINLSQYYDYQKTLYLWGMGLTKTEIFTAEQNRVADLAKAFAHPARVAILQSLARHGSCVCGELVDELPLAQATVSQHLKELKRIGIIEGNIDPPRVCYCINPAVWSEARRTFGAVLDAFVPAPDCCGVC
jgi:ArsR family transcriptional regulator, arsenate/arsenite/antimonite-responsive transcriptional repressor